MPIFQEVIISIAIILNLLSQSSSLRSTFSFWKPIIYIKWPTFVSASESASSLVEIRRALNYENSLAKIPIDWQIHLILATEHKTSVWDSYSINGDVIVEEISDIRFIQCHPLVGKPRGNLHGLEIRVTAVDDPENLNMVSYQKSGEKLEFSGGSSVQLLNDLRDILNFTVKALEGESYVSQLPNGSLGGIGGQLVDGKADLAIPLSYILPYRQAALTALHPIAVDRFLVFFRQPPASSVRYIFVKPFHPSLWLTLLVVWLLILISIFISRMVVGKIWDKDDFLGVNSGFLFVIAMISQQGWYASPRKCSEMIIFVSGLLTGLVPFIGYSASVISVLSAPSLPVKELSDLLATKFVIMADPLVNFGQYLRLDEDSPMRLEEVQEMLNTSYVNDEEAVVKVLEGGHAFINTLDFFSPIARSLNFSDQEICTKVSWVPLRSVSLAMAFYVPKGSPYKEALNTKILLTLERGLIHRYIRTLYTETRVLCEKKERRGSEELGMEDLFLAFALLGSSYVVCLILLTFEKYYDAVWNLFRIG